MTLAEINTRIEELNVQFFVRKEGSTEREDISKELDELQKRYDAATDIKPESEFDAKVKNIRPRSDRVKNFLRSFESTEKPRRISKKQSDIFQKILPKKETISSFNYFWKKSHNVGARHEANFGGRTYRLSIYGYGYNSYLEVIPKSGYSKKTKKTKVENNQFLQEILGYDKLHKSNSDHLDINLYHAHHEVYSTKICIEVLCGDENDQRTPVIVEIFCGFKRCFWIFPPTVKNLRKFKALLKAIFIGGDFPRPRYQECVPYEIITALKSLKE